MSGDPERYWGSGERLPADLLVDAHYVQVARNRFQRVKRVTPHPGGWVIVATPQSVLTLDGSKPVGFMGAGAVAEANEWGRQ